MAVRSRYVPVDLMGRRAVVVGTGIAGLASALALGERNAEVVMIDADAEPQARSSDEAFSSWQRKKVPQFRHSHAFLARLRNILLDAYPEVYQALLDEGARELRLLDFPPPTMGAIQPEPGDDQLAAIGCRRTTFEWVLRRHVARQPWVEIRCARPAAGLLGSLKRGVQGVRLGSGRGNRTTIEADLVVDATGRTSRAPRWLTEIGAPAPRERRSSSAVLYYTRFYRLLPGAEFPAPGEHPTMADFGWIKFAIFPADRSTFSITFATHLAFPRLKTLAAREAFEYLTQTLPGLSPFVDPAVARPISADGREVLAMGGLENCQRRFVDEEGNPLAAGFFAIGDSAYHTNPLYGRGSTQAFMHAGLLGEALDAAAGDAARAASFLDESAGREIEPFYLASVAADAEASRRVGAVPSSLIERLSDTFFQHGVLPATRVDPVVFRAFLRMFYMIETPAEAFFRPEVIARALAVWLQGPGLRRRVLPPSPDFDEIVTGCERAAGVARPSFGEPPARARA